MSSDMLGTRDWVEETLTLFSEGGSDAEVASALNLTIKEYYKAIQEKPAFAIMVEKGRTLSLAYWEGLARKNVSNKSFNTSLWAFYMKNKFGWAEKSETSATTENMNTNLDTLREQVGAALNKYLDQYRPEDTAAKKLAGSMRDA